MMAPLVGAALAALRPAHNAAVVLCDAAGEKFGQPQASQAMLMGTITAVLRQGSGTKPVQ